MTLALDKFHAYHTKSTAAARSVESYNHDGLELARRRAHRREFPLKQLAQLVLAVMLFKIFLFFQLGAGGYGARMAQLAEGNILEQLAAKAMILDPVSVWLIEGLRFGLW
ncbi:MAG: hypothetical protein QNJ44_01060 [Rhodobacter sp.]|nr:hypothetical protein [Rhodobacter sp.]